MFESPRFGNVSVSSSTISIQCVFNIFKNGYGANVRPVSSEGCIYGCIIVDIGKTVMENFKFRIEKHPALKTAKRFRPEA